MKLSVLPYIIKYYFPKLAELRHAVKTSEISSSSGTSIARYCYSVYFRHLFVLHEHGLDTSPKVLAELGPGNSIGLGLLSLLTGAEKY